VKIECDDIYQCYKLKVGMHPWIFSGDGEASVNFMSSSKNDISSKAKDYGVWISNNKKSFVNTDSYGYATFDSFLIKDISTQNLEVGF